MCRSTSKILSWACTQFVRKSWIIRTVHFAYYAFVCIHFVRSLLELRGYMDGGSSCQRSYSISCNHSMQFLFCVYIADILFRVPTLGLMD